MYYVEDLTVLHRKDHVSDKNHEAVWIQVDFSSVTDLFSVIYRVPDEKNFFDRFLKQLESAWLRSSYIFILGDVYCDLNFSDSVTKSSTQLSY